MKLFVVYEEKTGKIVRTGSCPDRDFERQVKHPTERIIAGTADKARHKVVDGIVVEK